MRRSDFNWRDHAKDSWAGTPDYEVLPEEPDLPTLDPSDAREIYEAAARSRVGHRKRRWVLDHSIPLFREPQSWLRRFAVAAAAITVVAIGLIGLMTAVRWLRPDAERANLRLTEAVEAYEATRPGFESGGAGCTGLVEAYARADAAFVHAAETYVKLAADADPSARARYERLIGRVDGMNRHFDASGCPRP
jgi:hypothetical protein